MAEEPQEPQAEFFAWPGAKPNAPAAIRHIRIRRYVEWDISITTTLAVKAEDPY